MKKRFYALVVSALILNVLLCGLPAYASVKDFTHIEAFKCEQITGGISIISVDVSKSGTNIVVPEKIDGKLVKKINVRYNELTSLDVSNCSALESLVCDNNPLSVLKLPKNAPLKLLNCRDNRLKSLDVSEYKDMKILDCSRNQLDSLRLPDTTSLEELSCYSNNLKELDVSQYVNLKFLSCYLNCFLELDISKNIVLKELHCNHNFIQDMSALNEWIKTHEGGVMPQRTILPVDDIKLLCSNYFANGETLILNTELDPETATFNDIVWSIKDSGKTGATIQGNKLTAKKPGKLTITATINSGKSDATAYKKDFTVIVKSKTSNVTIVCIISAVVLVLAGVLTLLVIRKKKY